MLSKKQHDKNVKELRDAVALVSSVFRENKGISIEELSKRCDVPLIVLEDFEAGKFDSHDFEYLFRLASFYDRRISITWVDDKMCEVAEMVEFCYRNS